VLAIAPKPVRERRILSRKKEKAPRGFSPFGAVFSGGLELSVALLYTDHKLDAATVL
jgi:hypothetical protein